MNPSADLLSFYAAPGIMTGLDELAPHFAALPVGIPELCAVVQGLLIHPLVAELYGVDLSSAQKKEVNIRPVREMVRLMLTLDRRPLNEARPANERVVGNCRDHAVLLCAMLRAQGRPARARPGFATYLEPEKPAGSWFSDHWIAEAWLEEQKRWVMVDAQIDALQRANLKMTFDPTDLPADAFYPAAKAWALCRAKKAKSGLFGLTARPTAGPSCARRCCATWLP